MNSTLLKKILTKCEVRWYQKTSLSISVRTPSNEVFKWAQNSEDDNIAPFVKPSFNLAAYANKSETNQRSIQDLTKELETKVEFNNYEDKEFYKLLEQEKLELEQKSIDCVHQLLDEIYKYEQNKDTELIGSGKINVLFEITAGVGGKEAMLFANELFEMYYHYFAYKRWTISDLETDEQNGMMRHVRGKVEGLDVWNHLRFEAGVHRVQRVPETESKGRIHTSTATVACIPLSSDIDIDLKDRDLKMETKRASGAGGQHVNKTESAVRLIHLPTGLAVECQEDRSQVKNRDIAIKKLKKILTDRSIQEVFEKMSATRKKQVGSSLRNEKIRTFNFNQDRLTDHRLSQQNPQSQIEKSSSVFGLQDFFHNPERLNELIYKLRLAEKEKYMLEIFEGLK